MHPLGAESHRGEQAAAHSCRPLNRDNRRRMAAP
jgi:hypothetical protein